ncbi:hypothetical protein MUK42_30096 [Musa troglodytarum]|uniref:RING-CH-type domain-containing protein n=1 Tax=Musa troglodytarum TaxID=320322 RepID=A0A9E7HAX4_9LILI|nr:hypothetical protein MUK42_30096 [Musa troglodytarum]
MVTLASLLLCSPRFVRSSGRMGDHLALLVDHLLTESTLEAAIGSRKHGQIAANSASLADPAKEFTPKSHVRGRTSVGKLVECRICQEEDEDCNMEIPCSCCGSLKYAHRKCVQRWCNEKGDTVCEICLQVMFFFFWPRSFLDLNIHSVVTMQFKPGYTAPPKLLQYGSIPMNFRGNWEITRQDRDDSQIIALVPSERDIVHADDDDDDDDDYSALGMRNTICRQSIVIIFTVLLVLPHTLPLMIGVAEQYSFTLFSVTHEISDPAEGENRIEPWQLVRSRPHHIQMH